MIWVILILLLLMGKGSTSALATSAQASASSRTGVPMPPIPNAIQASAQHSAPEALFELNAPAIPVKRGGPTLEGGPTQSNLLFTDPAIVGNVGTFQGGPTPAPSLSSGTAALVGTLTPTAAAQVEADTSGPLPDSSWGFDNGAFLFRQNGNYFWGDATGKPIATPTETAQDVRDIAAYSSMANASALPAGVAPGWN